MNQRVANARNLYLQGIGEGQVEIVKELTGDRYTQHSTGVPDGSKGFEAFFRDFLKRTTNRKIEIIRTIQDGSFVFVHVYQDIDNGAARWITTDLFDTDESGKLIEHWDVIAEYKASETTVSGNDMILGDFHIKDLDKTEENKALVRNFFVDIIQNKNHSNLASYISSEKYIQHNSNMPNGIEAVKTLLEKQEIVCDFVFKVIGEGNYVVSYWKAIFNNQELAVFDIFRVDGGRIVEHWDNIEPIPPRTEWKNTGKF